MGETYNVLKNLKCSPPETFASLPSGARVQVPVLERSDAEDFASCVKSSELKLFLGPSGSGKSTAFKQALHNQPLPCVYVSFREKHGVWESLMDQLSVRKGVFLFLRRDE